MKTLFFIFLTVAAVSFVWATQQSQRQSATLDNAWLAASIAEMQTRARVADSARRDAEQRVANLKAQLNLRNAAEAQSVVNAQPADTLVEPDPTHQGGWPAGAGYCYLPKQCLTNAAYKPISGGRLTDEAATLLGMTPTERSTVDQLLTNMLSQFRQLELKSMQPINPEWANSAMVGQKPDPSAGDTFMGDKLDSIVAYKIPDLGTDVETARQSFSQALQQTIGPSRAELLDDSADSYLRQNLDDLGARDRVIGFISVTERDGSPAIWYGVSDSLHGDGSFQRVPEDILDPNSQMAYYASLFGVKLPAKH